MSLLPSVSLDGLDLFPPLPNELHLAILRFCSPRTLASFCLSSFSMLELASPLLYRHVEIHDDVERLRSLFSSRDPIETEPRVAPYLSLPQTTFMTLLSTLSSNPYDPTTSAPPSPVFSLDRTESHSSLPLHTLLILLLEDQEDTFPFILPLVNPIHLVVRRLSSTPLLPSSDLACRAAFSLSPAWDRIISIEMVSCLLLTSGGTRTLFPGASNREVETSVDFSTWGDEGGQETLDFVASALQALSFEPWRVDKEEEEEEEGHRGRKSLRFWVGSDAWKNWLEYELGLLELGEDTMSLIEVAVRNGDD